jgi:hypothetical protein
MPVWKEKAGKNIARRGLTMPPDEIARRIADLEVAAKRRHDDAVNTDARLSEHAKRLDSLDILLRRLIDGDQPVADVRQDKAMRKRTLIAALAEASGLSYTDKAAKRVANIIAGYCPAPPGHEAKAAQLRMLFGKPPCQRTIWRYLEKQRALICAADITENWECQ